MRQLLRRLSYLLNRRRLEREMAEEMAYHREQMEPERRALFGDDLRLREDAREMWGWTWLDRLQQDVSYDGIRTQKAQIGDLAGSFDVITMHHSLEHIPDQAQTLEAIRALLSPSGVCLLRVPLVAQRVHGRPSSPEGSGFTTTVASRCRRSRAGYRKQ